MRRALLLGMAVVVAGVGAWLALRPRESTRATPRHEAVQAFPVPEEPVAPEPTAPARAAHPRIVGKVTGDEPLADVRIDTSREGGGASGTTNAKGAYAIDIALPEKAADVRIVAEAPDGRVGFGRAWIDPSSEESRALDIVLTKATGVLLFTEPRVTATLAVSQFTDARGSPFPVPLPLLHAENGEARVRLAIGKYELIARAEGFGRTRITFEVDESTREVRVPLAPERRLKVLVRNKADGTWVEGARLRLYESWRPYGTPDAFTDKAGSAVLGGLNRDDKLMLDVVGPGEVPQEDQFPTPRARHPVPADVDEMLVEILPPRKISWRIEAGDIPPPKDGTVIPLRKSAGTMVTPPAEGVMRDGRLWTEGWPPMAALGEAVGPEGTIARLFCRMDSDEGTPTRFLRGCNITVVVHRPDGSAAPGVTVGIFNQGNNVLGKATTDDDGVAKVQWIDGQLAELYVLGSSNWDRKELIGTVDLRKGDLRIEHTLMGRRRVEIRSVVDGQPALPEGRRLDLGKPLEETAEDPELGLVTGLLPIRAGAKTIRASLSTQGYLYETAEIEVPPGDEVIRHTFTLRRGTDLRVHEVGKEPEHFEFDLEREQGGYWVAVDANTRNRTVFPKPTRRTEADGWTYVGLSPGSYRIRLPAGSFFGPVTLASEGPPAEITLDYTRIAAIRGRVEVPEGTRPYEAFLVLEGDGIEMDPSDPWSSGGIHPAKDGTFEIPIPGDRKVRLSVRHPRLAPDPKRGSVETVAGMEGVVLALVEGPSLRFRIPQYFVKYAAYDSHPDWSRPKVEVRLFHGEPGGRPEFHVFARAAEREWKGGGFLPGIYTLWIDVPDSVPVVRRNVKLEEDTDLGEIPMEPGSTLRVRILFKEPFVPPRINVWANRLDEPRYYRGLNSNGEDLVLVTGLQAGRYHVTGGVTMQTGMGMLDEEIELDGANDVERTLDLR
jgi:hypothetical protein